MRPSILFAPHPKEHRMSQPELTTDRTADAPAPPETPAETAVRGTAEWGMPLRLFGIGLAFLILFLFVMIFVPIANIILLGFVFAFIFHAAARYLKRFARNYLFATIVVYLLVILVGIATVGSLAMHVARDVESMTTAVDSSIAAIRSGGTMPTLPPEVSSVLASVGYPDAAEALMVLLHRLTDSASAGLSSLVGTIGTVGVSLFFAFMLQLGLYSSRKSALAWVPDPHKRDAWLLLTKMDQTWAGYLIAGIIFASVLALLSFLQYTLMNVPFPVLLGIFTGFLTLIPSVGGILSTVLVFVVCIALGPTSPVPVDNTVWAVAVALVNGVLTQGTYYLVGLPITGRGVRLPIAIVFIGSMAGLATGNLFFAWLTVPIIASLRIGFGYLMSKANGAAPFPGDDVPDTPSQGFLSQLLMPAVGKRSQD